jgi:UDP-2-acetamido-3-amino-2,3-dideoxy-glucuronate N-acetyltransferase
MISDGASVWDFSQIRENAVIGQNSIIGSYVYIDANVRIGSNCKIQNRALIYDSALIRDGVFIGPGAILTNDQYPRAINSDESLKLANHWRQVGVTVEKGASIGAGATIIAPLVIGNWAMIGAGAVVTKDVKAFALVVGNPAVQIGWVGKSGARLEDVEKGLFICPVTKEKYELYEGELAEKGPGRSSSFGR